MSTYLVTQATGQQSQSVITHLLAAGAKVHAVVRDLKKDLPAILKSDGVALFQGDSTDEESIFEAAKGCKGAFLNTFPQPPGNEARQAKAVTQAAKRAGIEVLVAATTIQTNERRFWDNEATKKVGLYDYYISKTAIEDTVRAANFRAYTILRPGFIHFDYLLPASLGNFPRLSTHGELDHCYDDGVRMYHTDGSDIGKYAAAALQDPAKFGGQEIDLVNEYLSTEEARDILTRVSGKKITARRIDEPAAFGQVFARWCNAVDMSSKADAGRKTAAKYGIPLTSFEEFARREKERFLASIPADLPSAE